VIHTTRRLTAVSATTILIVMSVVLARSGIDGTRSLNRADAAVVRTPAGADTDAGRDRDPRLASAVRPVGAAAPATQAFDPTRVSLGLQLVVNGFRNPLLVTNAGDGSHRLFVIEQAGDIRIITDGTLLATPFLDLRGAISSGGERGLLGLAFDPNYPTVPYFYVNFTNLRGDTAINRYRVSSNPNVAIRSSGLRILTITQPYPNHNGGNLVFGPDSFLYIGMGDGGSAGDPQNRAQSLSSLLGKMLRIDVHHHTATTNYRVPASNPYVGRTGDDRIWSRGLRNPWRWSFDRVTGQLWIGDVGQNLWEEVDRNSPTSSAPAGRAANYGWPVLEGRACYKPATGCSTSGKQAPLLVYAHAVSGTANCAITGGFVYRGGAYPALSGGYLFGDFCSGRIWVVSARAAAPATATLLRSDSASPHLAISSFGENERGELYVCDLAGGAVYRITAVATP
jgi:glucose/arabinose dehydrogenase